jgi:hypothetical protein
MKLRHLRKKADFFLIILCLLPFGLLLEQLGIALSGFFSTNKAIFL